MGMSYPNPANIVMGTKVTVIIGMVSFPITFKTTEGFALLGSVFNAKWVIKFSPAIIKGIPMVA
jgi:hypothetical protein